MLSTNSPTAGPDGPISPEVVDLPTTMAEAARTAHIYHVNANRAETGFRGAPDQAWLVSQSAVCVARQHLYTERAVHERDDRNASRWRALALGYAEAAGVLAKAAEGTGKTVAALLAAAELLKVGTSLRSAAPSAAPAYIDLWALTAAFHEAQDCGSPRALHTIEAEMLLMACYARTHNPTMLTAVTHALSVLAHARTALFAAEPVTQALEAVSDVIAETGHDPLLTSD